MVDGRPSSRVNISIVQVVILLGLVTAGLLICFYLGYYTGRKMGLEEALDANLANSVKLPIAPTQGQSEKQSLTEVYDKLKESKQATREEAKKEAGKPTAPNVAAIASVTQAPVGEAMQPQVKNEESRDDLEAIRQALLGSSSSANTVKGVQMRELGRTPAPKLAPETEALLDGEDSEHTISNTDTPLGAISEDDATLRPTGIIRTPTARLTPTQRATVTPRATATPRFTATAMPRATPNRRSFDEETPTTQQQNSAKLPRGWYAQIAAPPTEEEALQLVRRLRSSGFAAAIERAAVRDQHYFRVLVGPEQSRELGMRMLQELKREPYIRSEPFMRMVR